MLDQQSLCGFSMLHHLGIQIATSQSTVSSLHIESIIVELAFSVVSSRAMNRSFREFLRPISKLALSFVSFLFVLWLHSDYELIALSGSRLSVSQYPDCNRILSL